MSFSQLPAVKKDTENGAPGNILEPSFFVTALDAQPNSYSLAPVRYSCNMNDIKGPILYLVQGRICFALDFHCSKAKHFKNVLGHVLGQKQLDKTPPDDDA